MINQNKIAKNPVDGYDYVFFQKVFRDQEYENLMSNYKLCGLKEFQTLNTGEGLIIPYYIPEIARMFDFSELELFERNSQTTQICYVKPFQEKYIKGYKSGIKYFKENWQLKPSDIYSPYGKQLERDLHRLYHHPTEGKAVGGAWKRMVFIQISVISLYDAEQYGFYAALHNSINELKIKHPNLFGSFDKHTENTNKLQKLDDLKFIKKNKVTSEVAAIIEFASHISIPNYKGVSEKNKFEVVQKYKKLGATFSAETLKTEYYIAKKWADDIEGNKITTLVAKNKIERIEMALRIVNANFSNPKLEETLIRYIRELNNK